MTFEFKAFALICAVLAGFCFRAGEQTVVAQANCQVWTCTDVWAWSTTTTSSISAHDINNKTSTQAIPSLYAPFSTGKNPIVKGVFIAEWTYPKSNIPCPQINGGYPAPLEVSPSGTPTKGLPVTQQYKCS